jgi:hypothetical protein
MKNHGEFLATSQILGRPCGFAVSQVNHINSQLVGVNGISNFMSGLTKHLPTCEKTDSHLYLLTKKIARAAEKGALLVANVPLSIAVSLREWNFQPTIALILSSTTPHFRQNDDRRETLRRNSEQEAKERERRMSGEEYGEYSEQEPNKDHLVRFEDSRRFCRFRVSDSGQFNNFS